MAQAPVTDGQAGERARGGALEVVGEAAGDLLPDAGDDAVARQRVHRVGGIQSRGVDGEATAGGGHREGAHQSVAGGQVDTGVPGDQATGAAGSRHRGVGRQRARVQAGVRRYGVLEDDAARCHRAVVGHSQRVGDGVADAHERGVDLLAEPRRHLRGTEAGDGRGRHVQRLLAVGVTGRIRRVARLARGGGARSDTGRRAIHEDRGVREVVDGQAGPRQVGGAAQAGIRHERDPGTGGLDVAVAVGEGSGARVVIPVVTQPHVVAQLVDKGDRLRASPPHAETAALEGGADRCHEISLAAPPGVQRPQADQVGTPQVAQGVHVVQVAVVLVPQPGKIDVAAAALGVVDLLSVNDADPLVDPRIGVGCVGVQLRQVDIRLQAVDVRGAIVVRQFLRVDHQNVDDLVADRREDRGWRLGGRLSLRQLDRNEVGLVPYPTAVVALLDEVVAVCSGPDRQDAADSAVAAVDPTVPDQENRSSEGPIDRPPDPGEAAAGHRLALGELEDQIDVVEHPKAQPLLALRVGKPARDRSRQGVDPQCHPLRADDARLGIPSRRRTAGDQADRKRLLCPHWQRRDSQDEGQQNRRPGCNGPSPNTGVSFILPTHLAPPLRLVAAVADS